jgi:hypothetical protein
MGDETASKPSFVPNESAVAAGAQDGYQDDLGYNLRPMVWKGGTVLLILGCGVHGELDHISGRFSRCTGAVVI